jgi:hypothetical protein
MKKSIGIYASNDWAEAKAFAQQLRAADECTVRLRDGASFTPDQVEPFDEVLVRGDFPAVMAAYPQAKALDVAPNPEATALPAADNGTGEGDDDPAAHDATLDAAPKRGPGRPPKAR